MNIATVLRFKYPNSESLRDWIVQDNSDGKGPYIAVWNLPNPQPTKTELEAIWNSPEFQTWHKGQQKEIIDYHTAQAIRKRIHPRVPVDEEFAILREQIVHILNGDLSPTEDFALLNAIAITEIEKRRLEKEALKKP